MKRHMALAIREFIITTTYLVCVIYCIFLVDPTSVQFMNLFMAIFALVGSSCLATRHFLECLNHLIASLNAVHIDPTEPAE